MKTTNPKTKPWNCDHCGKRFMDAASVRMHHNKKHRGKKLAHDVKVALHSDDDESFASRAIQASLDRAMGIDNPDYDWLVAPYE